MSQQQEPRLPPLAPEPPPRDRPGMALGVTGLVLGAVALPAAMLPCTFFLAVPVAGLGLASSFLGLLVSYRRNETGGAWCACGVAVSGLAALFAWGWLSFFRSL
jgi:hypothetical protein